MPGKHEDKDKITPQDDLSWISRFQPFYTTFHLVDGEHNYCVHVHSPHININDPDLSQEIQDIMAPEASTAMRTIPDSQWKGAVINVHLSRSRAGNLMLTYTKDDQGIGVEGEERNGFSSRHNVALSIYEPLSPSTKQPPRTR